MERKVGHVLFNPSAENILASSSGDYTTKIWDVETGSAKLKLDHGDIVQSLSWSANGSQLVTTCRDKKLRIWDVRQEKPAHEVAGHSGAKNSRAVWMGEHDRIATTGFSKMSDRQLGLWDVRAPREPMDGFTLLDSISGVCMPFWDDGTQCLYLAGKGDGNIRYFEYQNNKFEFLSEYKSVDPQRGLAFLPKRGVNMHENEVMRAFKTVNDAYIEPISFIVPRRAEVFQSDVYPPTVGGKRGLSGLDWLNGKDAFPPKIDLESVYEGGETVELPAATATSTQRAEVPLDTKPKAPTQPTEEAKPDLPIRTPSPAPTTTTTTQRGSPPSMKDQKSSIANIASKFQDHASDEDSSDGSSFEEVAKPTERSLPPASSLAAKPPQRTEPPVSTGAAAKSPASTTAPLPSTTATSRPLGSSSSVEQSLQTITQLLQNQHSVITAQSDQIGKLTQEVDRLKTRVGGDGGQSSREKDERIRMLELELEQSRG
ncbi:MAG: Coronin-like protein crn1 [Vezdaea aestivalis]|nr:MAG: Coronin-like protein crn1 [Vezdaea aestivalis]